MKNKISLSRILTFVLAPVSAILLAACGGSFSQGSQLRENAESLSTLQVQVLIADEANAVEELIANGITLSVQQQERLRVQRYHIELSRPDIADGFSQEFFVSAEQAGKVLDSLKPATDYQLTVKALNSFDEVLYAQSLRGLEVIAGVSTPIEMRLVALPFFLNVFEGAVLTQAQNELWLRAENGQRFTLSIESFEGSETFSEDRILTIDDRRGFYQIPLRDLPLGRVRLSMTDPIFGQTISLKFFNKTNESLGWTFQNAAAAESYVRIGGGMGSTLDAAFPEYLLELSGFEGGFDDAL